jgi:hypothetical protein
VLSISPCSLITLLFSFRNDTECSEAIGNMKLNKSPGLDGLTVEFYRAFWGKLKIVLTDIYNKRYNEAVMSYSQRSSILSLLFKKGDPLYENYSHFYFIYVCIVYDILYLSKIKTNNSIFTYPV